MSDARLGVLSIEPLKTMRLYDISTETGFHRQRRSEP